MSGQAASYDRNRSPQGSGPSHPNPRSGKTDLLTHGAGRRANGYDTAVCQRGLSDATPSTSGVSAVVVDAFLIDNFNSVRCIPSVRSKDDGDVPNDILHKPGIV